MTTTTLRCACRASARTQRLVWPLLFAASAGAQETAGPPRALAIEPTFSTSVSVVDSRRPTLGDSTEAVLQLQPGLRLRVGTGRLRATAQYAMTALSRSGTGTGRGTEISNSLTSSGFAELIPGWMFVDATANVSQQSLSAYGVQNVGLLTDNPNRAEVATVSISPYVRGFFGPAVRYEARVTVGGANARRSKRGDSRSEGALLSLGSATVGVLGWGLDLTSDRNHFRLGRDTQVDRALGSLSYRPDPEIGLTARGGQERSDVLSLDPRSYANWGAGVRWTPTERTGVSGDFDHRYFGNAYSASISQRWRLSSFRVSSTRTSNAGSNAGGQLSAITLYQLYDLLLTSQYPDPIERDRVVRQRIGTQDPNTLVQGGFVNSGINVTRRDDIGWTYAGLRTSFSIVAFRSSSRRLDVVGNVAEADATNQRGYTAQVSYQLTPTAALAANGSVLLTPGSGTTPGTRLTSAALTWTDYIGRYTSVSANARYSVFNSPTDPYREAALTASLSLRF